MLIVYTPAGAEAEHLDVRSVRTNEASIASRAADLTWKQIKERLADDDPEAMRIVAWVIKKRSNPSLRLQDFDPLVEELAFRLSNQEVKEWATEAVASIDEGIDPEAVLIALQPIVDAACDAGYARELILKLAAAPKDQAATADPEHQSDPTTASTPTDASTSDSSPTSST